MSVWRPHQGIRVKALGLVFRDDALLCFEVCRDDGTVYGVRPLGGGIEFGETREMALRREFQEELSTDIERVGDWIDFENIYDHEGQMGHEIIFAAPVQLADRNIYAIERMAMQDGVEVAVGWFRRQQLLERDWILFPVGLAERLEEKW